MAKLPDGIFGGIIGSTANVTGYKLNGQNIIRVKSRPVTHFSEKQLENQQRMLVINRFFRAMKPFLKAGFSMSAKGTTRNYHNLATSYNKKNALTGSYPNIRMDYSKALLTTGNLLEAQSPAVEVVTEGLKFSWDFPEGNDSHSRADQVMMLAYCPETGDTRFFLYGAARIEKQAILELANKMKGQYMETYISFISNDRLNIANSVYIGSVNQS